MNKNNSIYKSLIDYCMVEEIIIEYKGELEEIEMQNQMDI